MSHIPYIKQNVPNMLSILLFTQGTIICHKDLVTFPFFVSEFTVSAPASFEFISKENVNQISKLNGQQQQLQ